MYLSPLESQIVLALRHGPLDHFQIAADVQAAPFMVRASLRRMRGDRLVLQNFPILTGRNGWELTGRGQRVADDLATDQLEFPVLS